MIGASHSKPHASKHKSVPPVESSMDHEKYVLKFILKKTKKKEKERKKVLSFNRKIRLKREKRVTFQKCK